MPEVNVQDEQGNLHVFPDGSTPEMIAQALKVKPPTPLPNAGLSPPNASVNFSRLPLEGSSGEGPIAQGMTSMENRFSQIPSALLSAAQGGVQTSHLMSGNQPLPSQPVGDKLAALNPIATGEGSLPRNIGATAANVLPFLIDPAGGGIASSPIGKLAGAARSAVGEVTGQAALDRAKGAFQGVMSAANNNAVPVTNDLSQSLSRYQDLVNAGGSRSLSVSKLLNRVTAPNASPLTYSEARDFASNISRLSADEAQRLTPVMRRQVGEIRSALNDAITQTAQGAGQGDQYTGAMQDYSKGMGRQETISDLGDLLKKGAVTTVGGGLAGYGASKFIDAIRKKK